MWFKRNAKTVALIEQIEQLSRHLAELRGEQSALDLTAQLESLLKQKTKLEIELDKIREHHGREIREIEHKVGLHKLKVEQEIEASKRSAALGVREEALAKQQKRFEEHMKFQRERFEKEIDATRHLMDQLLTRLPTVNVERQYRTVETFSQIEAPVEEDE